MAAADMCNLILLKNCCTISIDLVNRCDCTNKKGNPNNPAKTSFIFYAKQVFYFAQILIMVIVKFSRNKTKKQKDTYEV